MMKKYQISIRLMLLLISLMAVSSSSKRSWMVKPGCTEFCGKVQIPYPFGIGAGCALKESYAIICRESSSRRGNSTSTAPTPFLRIQSNSPSQKEVEVEVQSVGLWDQTMTIKSPARDQVCRMNQRFSNKSVRSNNLEGTPFFYSKDHNRLMLLGCGNALLSHHRVVLSGCTSSCQTTDGTNNIRGCYGIKCCETNIPFDLTRYSLESTITDFRSTDPCAFAFLAQQKWGPRPAGRIPVILSWTLQSSELHRISGCVPKSIELITQSRNSSWESMGCVCSPPYDRALLDLNGSYNPYVDGACDQAFLSYKRGKNRTEAIIGATVGFGVLALLLAICSLYKLLKKRRTKMRKDKFFKRNGGLLLKQQISAEGGVVEKTKIFTDKELNNASNGFSTNRILGQGGQGTVYKGMLTDGRLVAIKKAKKVSESQLKVFINEVVILSQVNHRNVVKLLGCCLETEVPLLVYEFVPNGTLYDLIHNQSDDFPLTWNLRLRIATEIAGALAYLHSAVATPIFHRDIKSSNILLDEKYVSKVSDFGTSRSVSTEKTHLTTLVRGTFGYLDPEYFQSSQFTEKSDVYSFGVVMVELLTRRKPISSTESEEDSHLSLATKFLTSMDAHCLDTILDPQVLNQSNKEEITVVAKLAQRCLNLERNRRPTMKEVAMELESIKMGKMHSTIHEHFQSSRARETPYDSDTNDTLTAESDEAGSSSDN